MKVFAPKGKRHFGQQRCRQHGTKEEGQIHVNCIHLKENTYQWFLLRVRWRTSEFYLVMWLSRKTLFHECIDLIHFSNYNVTSSTIETCYCMYKQKAYRRRMPNSATCRLGSIVSRPMERQLLGTMFTGASERNSQSLLSY